MLQLTQGKTFNYKATQGFSLLEILVAFSILFVFLGVILKIFSSGLNLTTTAENYTNAVQIANSLLAKTGVENELKTTSTTKDKNGFTRKIDITPAELNLDETFLNSIAITPMQVQVTVSWKEGKRQRELVLTTIKLMKKPR